MKNAASGPAKGKKHMRLGDLLVSAGLLTEEVAIAIPIFTAQLEKSREATDKANLRSAYAEVSAALLDDDTVNQTKTVAAKQKETDWQSSEPEIGGIKDVEAKTAGSSWTVTVSGGKVVIN